MRSRLAISAPDRARDHRAMRGEAVISAPDHLRLDHMPTPIGEVFLVSDEHDHLRALGWLDTEPSVRRLLQRRWPATPIERGRAPRRVVRALEAYFGGELSRLDSVVCAPGGTPFQLAVWAALRAIPAGQTLSYGGLAARLGLPRAGRAVGFANGANPIAIVIPCHRLVGARGALTGYGGGLERKRWLLAHEGTPTGVRVDAGFSAVRRGKRHR